MSEGAKRVIERATIAAHPDGSLRLAVVADTHSSPHPSIGTRLAALAPDAILHAGDIGDLRVLDRLRAIAPVFAVRGNIDGAHEDVAEMMTLDVTTANADRVLLRIFMLHIAVYGPKLRADVARMARAEDASIVVCGHSHVPFIARDGDALAITVFNPGSIGPRRFALPIVFGALDLSPTEVRLAHIDCETGEPWRPKVERRQRDGVRGRANGTRTR